MTNHKESFSPAKFFFTLLLLALAGYFILDQCRAIDWLTNAIANGSAAATYRGMH